MSSYKKIGKWLSGISEKITNSVSRKYQRPDGKFMDPDKFELSMKWLVPCTILVVIVYVVMTNSKDYKAYSTLKQEREAKVAIGETIGTSLSIEKQSQKDQFSNEVIRSLNEAKKDSIVNGTYGSASTTGSDGNGTPVNGEKVNKFECKELLDKIKKGDDLNIIEQGKAQTCAKENTLGLTPDQQKAFEASIDPTVPKSARQELANFASEANPDPNDPRGALARGLTGNKEQRESAILGLSNYNKLSDAEKKLLADSARGLSVDKNELAKIAGKYPLKEDDDNKNGANGTLANGLSGSNSQGNSSPTLSQLADKIAYLKGLLAELMNNNKKIEDDIKKSSEKGDTQGIINQAQNKKENEAKKNKVTEELENTKLKFNEIYKANQVEILKSKKIAKGESISGISEVNIEDDIPEFVPKKTSSFSLTTDEMKIVDLLNSLKKNKDRKANNLAQYGDVKFETDGSQMFLEGATKKLGLKLPGNARIVSQLETVISISEQNMANFPVQSRVLLEVPDVNNKIVIKKNAILSGRTVTFDVETEMCTIVFTKLTSGPDTIDVAFSAQIKGAVIDNRMKTVAGAVAVDAVGSITEKIIKDAQNNVSSTNATLAETSSLAGVTMGATAMQKIAQILANDLQTAKKVFFAPPGVPIVIYP